MAHLTVAATLLAMRLAGASSPMPIEDSAAPQSAGTATVAPDEHASPLIDPTRRWALVLLLGACGTILACVQLARRGMPVRIRRIAALDSIDEAVGRATEMGRPLLFVPGSQDMNEIETIAGLTVLGRVSRTVAEYDSTIEVPTARSLVMTAARESVHSAYLTAGRPDSFNPDLIYYVTDEQFGYVAYLTGHMTRQRPAACFYMGKFFAESLILAETGNAIGAIQIAGTAETSQLPFFVAACDYTLIGEEFFAASAYLSGEKDQLGSLRGQDLGKLAAMILLVVGAGLATLAAILGPTSWAGSATEWLTGTLLR